MIRFSSFLRVTLALSASLSAPALDRKISEKTARRLVQEALVALAACVFVVCDQVRRFEADANDALQ